MEMQVFLLLINLVRNEKPAKIEVEDLFRQLFIFNQMFWQQKYSMEMKVYYSLANFAVETFG